MTITCEGVSTTYEAQIMDYMPGDTNNDGFVNRDDVMLLLWHINFPDENIIFVPADFNEDGFVNRDDVMQLLWHINFPEEYPLTK